MDLYKEAQVRNGFVRKVLILTDKHGGKTIQGRTKQCKRDGWPGYSVSTPSTNVPVSHGAIGPGHGGDTVWLGFETFAGDCEALGASLNLVVRT
jgi:hypothetical protein